MTWSCCIHAKGFELIRYFQRSDDKVYSRALRIDSEGSPLWPACEERSREEFCSGFTDQQLADCRKCKHRLRCLVDPGAQVFYERIV